MRICQNAYGLTYAFPILVALLTARKDQVVIVDSPEARHKNRRDSNRRLDESSGAGQVSALLLCCLECEPHKGFGQIPA
jgi:hypothetical protein